MTTPPDPSQRSVRESFIRRFSPDAPPAAPAPRTPVPRDQRSVSRAFRDRFGPNRMDSAPAAPAAGEPPAAAPAGEQQQQQAPGVTPTDLMAKVRERLAFDASQVQLPPATVLRRHYKELPGSQREAIARKIESEDYGMSGYFNARGYDESYQNLLVADALAKRLEDGQRLKADLSPAELLQMMAPPSS